MSAAVASHSSALLHACSELSGPVTSATIVPTSPPSPLTAHWRCQSGQTTDAPTGVGRADGDAPARPSGSALDLTSTALLPLQPTRETQAARSASPPLKTQAAPEYPYESVAQGSFEPSKHFYPRALNCVIHPTVRFFLGLSRERIVARHCHNNPLVNKAALAAALAYAPQHVHWAGADLMHVTSCGGRKRMVVIETNSCPSGQKSTPLMDDHQEEGGYRVLLQRSLLPRLPPRAVGELAIVYDKNPMEASGYAAALADLTGETVLLVPFMDGESAAEACVRFDAEGYMEVRLPPTRPQPRASRAASTAGSDSDGHSPERENRASVPAAAAGRWVRVRGGVRYVTQRPWNRIPVDCPTVLMNPLIACLAGGRNKLVASKAYDAYNAELEANKTGLGIKTPMTIPDVAFEDLAGWVAKLGGCACIKVPYSNAGQGVYTITSAAEFAAFEADQRGSQYSKYIVQSLISNHEWSSQLEDGRFYHVGTIPDKRGDIYVADLRLMVSGSADGFSVVGLYGRKAPLPLAEALLPGADSWSMLGTNLSVKLEGGKFTSESERLLLMDRRDFNTMGVSLDELIDAYVQSCLAVIAIDRMAISLMPGGRFSRALLRAVDDDAGLMDELM